MCMMMQKTKPSFTFTHTRTNTSIHTHRYPCVGSSLKSGAHSVSQAQAEFKAVSAACFSPYTLTPLYSSLFSFIYPRIRRWKISSTTFHINSAKHHFVFFSINFSFSFSLPAILRMLWTFDGALAMTEVCSLISFLNLQMYLQNSLSFLSIFMTYSNLKFLY